MTTRRPPLNRGHSMPTYMSQSQPYSGGVDNTITSLACLTLSDSRSSSVGARAGEAMRRGLTASSSEGSCPTTPPLFSLRELPRDGRTHYPTAPHSAFPLGHHSVHTQLTSYFPPQPPSSSRSKVHSAQPTSPGSMSSLPTSPAMRPPAIISPPALQEGGTVSQSSVNMKIESTPHQHILVAPLGNGFSTESITITARKGNVIVVVAERWDQEQDFHHEWHVQFDRDGDMSSVQATFENGVLRIIVRRLDYNVPP